MKIKTLNTYLENTPYHLSDTASGLALIHPKYKPLIINFLSGASRYRHQKGGGLTELIAKACLASKKPMIFDLTAGLGRDAFVLASLGCEVKMFERHPVLAALLRDGLKRLKLERPGMPLSLIQKDSLVFLGAMTEHTVPDVIYYDPMHPARKKSALVKKEMRILADIVGGDEDKQTVFEAIKGMAQKRVVVKWPIDEPPIAEAPDLVYKGKSTRFDIYLNHPHASS